MTPMGIRFLLVQVPEHQAGDETCLVEISHHYNRILPHRLYQQSRFWQWRARYQVTSLRSGIGCLFFSALHFNNGVTLIMDLIW